MKSARLAMRVSTGHGPPAQPEVGWELRKRETRVEKVGSHDSEYLDHFEKLVKKPDLWTLK